MAGGELSGRRGAVHSHAGRAPHLRALHPAAHRACRVPHAAASPSRATLGFAGLLADVSADRVQPDAARRRHRHQFFLAAVCDPGLGAAAQGNRRPGALAGAARGLWRRAHRHRAGSGRVPGRRAVRACERRPLRVGHRGRARNDHDRIGADADPLPTGAAHRLLRTAAALGLDLAHPGRRRVDRVQRRLQRRGTILVDARAAPRAGFRRNPVQLSLSHLGEHFGIRDLGRCADRLSRDRLRRRGRVGSVPVLAREQRSASQSCPPASERLPYT